MEVHLKFRKGKQTKFIDDIVKKSLKPVAYLAKISNVSPRNFRDWRNERLCIRKSATLVLLKKYNVKLPEDIKKLEDRWIKFKSRNGKIGGYAFKKIYGNPATPEGRSKGGRNALKILRERGIIPESTVFNHPYYSRKLAEFVGILLGDGGITNEQIQITLNSIADKEYLEYVKTLAKNLFKVAPKTFKKKDCNANVIYYNGVNLVNFLKEIGLKTGNKVKQQVGVPPWINKKCYKIACLRGLMDTDGGVFIHRYKVNGKEYSYKKICFTNYSVPLLSFVHRTLSELGFTPKIINDIGMVNKKVWLYNSKEVKQYFEVVGSSNERLNKFK